MVRCQLLVSFTGELIIGRWLIIVLAVSFVAALPGTSAGEPRSTSGQPARQDTTRPTEKSASDGFEDFGRMLLERPDVPITVPVGPRTQKKRGLNLPAPGSMIIDRPCWLERDWRSDGFVLRFPQAAPQDRLRVVLPSRWLEEMEALAARTPAMVFRVSGESMVYRQRSYILIHNFTIQTQQKGMKPSPATQPAATSQPASAAGAPAAKQTTVTPESIIKRLMQDRAGESVVIPLRTGRGRPVASVAPVTAPELSTRWGKMVVDRLVRIIQERDGQWWQVRFEADNTLREPPLRLLPCRLLEKAESLAAPGSGKIIRLRISGQITWYRDRCYLLLRKVLREPEMGQL